MDARHRARLGSTENLDPSKPRILHGGNMAFSRQVIESVPGFDVELGPGTSLPHHEDTLFSLQLQEAGYEIASAFEAEVEHHFEPSHLLRRSWLEDAVTQGRSSAYLYHHWHHGVTKHPRGRLLWLTAYKAYLHMKRPRDWWKRHEGCAHWEYDMVEAIAAARQYLIERKRPRNYERRGLKKIRGEPLLK